MANRPLTNTALPNPLATDYQPQSIYKWLDTNAQNTAINKIREAVDSINIDFDNIASLTQLLNEVNTVRPIFKPFSVACGKQNAAGFADYIVNTSTDITSLGTAISSGDLGSYPMANAYDGNTSTYWASSQSGTGVSGVAYIGRNFAITKLLKQIVIRQYSDPLYALTSIKVQSSTNGSTWVDVQTFNGLTTGLNTLNLTTEISTQYVRLLANNNLTSTNAWRVFELKFYSDYNDRVTFDASVPIIDVYADGSIEATTTNFIATGVNDSATSIFIKEKNNPNIIPLGSPNYYTISNGTNAIGTSGTSFAGGATCSYIINSGNIGNFWVGQQNLASKVKKVAIQQAGGSDLGDIPYWKVQWKYSADGSWTNIIDLTVAVKTTVIQEFILPDYSAVGSHMVRVVANYAPYGNYAIGRDNWGTIGPVEFSTLNEGGNTLTEENFDPWNAIIYTSNLVTTGHAIASSSMGANIAANAFDGTTAFWAGGEIDGNVINSYIGQSGLTSKVRRVKLTNYYNNDGWIYCPSSIIIQFSTNGTTWTDIVTVAPNTGNGQFTIFELPDYSASGTHYVRLKANVGLNRHSNFDAYWIVGDLEMYDIVSDIGNDGDFWRNFGVKPNKTYKKMNGVWTPRQFTKRGEVTRTSGVLGAPVSYAFNGKQVIAPFLMAANQSYAKIHNLGFKPKKITLKGSNASYPTIETIIPVHQNSYGGEGMRTGTDKNKIGIQTLTLVDSVCDTNGAFLAYINTLEIIVERD